MKGFLIITCLFCALISVAYALKFYNEKKQRVKAKRQRTKIDLPFKDVVIKIKRKR